MLLSQGKIYLKKIIVWTKLFQKSRVGPKPESFGGEGDFVGARKVSAERRPQQTIRNYPRSGRAKEKSGSRTPRKEESGQNSRNLREICPFKRKLCFFKKNGIL